MSRRFSLASDAGPLIALARTGLLHLLRDLFVQVAVPPAVVEELRLEEGRAGAAVLAQASEAGWLRTVALESSTREIHRLRQSLDAGEAEAIALASEIRDARLLIDEKRGRAVARRSGLRVIGSGGVLLMAKSRGQLEAVGPALERLGASGYRLSRELRLRILELAGEERAT